MAFDVIINQFHDVPSLGVLHDNAKTIRSIIEKGLFKLHNVLIIERSKYPNLVEGIFFLFIFHSQEFDLFQGVNLIINFPSHNEDLPKCTLS